MSKVSLKFEQYNCTMRYSPHLACLLLQSKICMVKLSLILASNLIRTPWKSVFHRTNAPRLQSCNVFTSEHLRISNIWLILCSLREQVMNEILSVRNILVLHNCAPRALTPYIVPVIYTVKSISLRVPTAVMATINFRTITLMWLENQHSIDWLYHQAVLEYANVKCVGGGKVGGRFVVRRSSGKLLGEDKSHTSLSSTNRNYICIDDHMGWS